ncbi:MAG: uncharacterized protein K0R27_2803 [Xanthobacteraceae bacterium]|jgi:hypothetical protein|nr:uncharacterized protein [Xanthobacteraceae bacterium]
MWNETAFILSGLAPFYERIKPLTYSLLRVAFGLTIATHGLPKLTGSAHGSMGEAWLRLSDKYGSGQNVIGMLTGHLNKMATDIALAEVVGPNHGAIVRAALKHVGEQEAGFSTLQRLNPVRMLESALVPRRTYDVLTGRANAVEGPLMSGIFGGLRSIGDEPARTRRKGSPRQDRHCRPERYASIAEALGPDCAPEKWWWLSTGATSKRCGSTQPRWPHSGWGRRDIDAAPERRRQRHPGEDQFLRGTHSDTGQPAFFS